uniref:Endonuclease/exonuclease/phosphatase domain-containing protein n=1 Tax=Heliothis virescens TaxID=7102 RepID=A0A2A4J310_HELVI
MNTFFQKPPQRKWTWRHPDGHKNEYDYILTDRKNIVTDVTVLNRFSTSSDHRLVRAVVKLNIQKERRTLTKRPKVLPRDVMIEVIRANKSKYQTLVEDKLNTTKMQTMSIEDLNQHITDALKSSVETITPKDVGNFKPQKLSQETLNLLEDRRMMRQNGDTDTPTFRKLQRRIRQSIKDDLQQYQEKLITRALEQNTSRRVLKAKLSSGKKEIFQLFNNRNEVISNREQLLDIARTFYSSLYESKVLDQSRENETYRTRPPVINIGSEEIPDVLVDEIELALHQMKNGKAPGQDNILPDMLKLGPPGLRNALAFLFTNQIFRSNRIPQKLKSKVFDQCVLPVFTYGMETATLTLKSAESLRVAQRAMERCMLGITLLDHKTNEWIRNKTRVRDVVNTITRWKWRWAGHIARMSEDRWTRRVMEWRPWGNTRGRGRPPQRWVDDIKTHAGPNWMQVARDRKSWKNMEEAYVRKRIS